MALSELVRRGRRVRLVSFLALAVPGVVIARRQPTNPIGWILIGIGVGLAFYTDVEAYAVLDYHFHHGDLPLGPAAVLVASNLWIGLFLALPLVILLFPDGRLSRRWRMVLWAYLAVGRCWSRALSARLRGTCTVSRSRLTTPAT